MALICDSTMAGLHRFRLRNSSTAMDVGRSAPGNNRWTQVRLLRHRRVLGLQERGERLRLSGALLPLQADVSDGSRGTQGRAVCRHHHDPRCRTARRCSDGQVSVIYGFAVRQTQCKTSERPAIRRTLVILTGIGPEVGGDYRWKGEG